MKLIFLLMGVVIGCSIGFAAFLNQKEKNNAKFWQRSSERKRVRRG